jgi:hypothetical protein
MEGRGDYGCRARIHGYIEGDRSRSCPLNAATVSASVPIGATPQNEARAVFAPSVLAKQSAAMLIDSIPSQLVCKRPSRKEAACWSPPVLFDLPSDGLPTQADLITCWQQHHQHQIAASGDNEESKY